MSTIGSQLLDRLERWLSTTDDKDDARSTGAAEGKAELALVRSGGARRLADLVGKREALRYQRAVNLRRALLVDLQLQTQSLSMTTTDNSSKRVELRRSLGGAGRIVARLNGMRHEQGKQFNELAQYEYVQSLEASSVKAGAVECGEPLPSAAAESSRQSGPAASALVVCDLLSELTWLEQATVTTEQAQSFLSELLDLCDVLALSSTAEVLRCARDYHDNDRSWRARRLLRSRLADVPDEPELQAAMARALSTDRESRRDWRKISAAFGTALASNPDDAELHRDLARVLLEAGRVEQAIPHFEQALHQWPNDDQLQADAAHAHQLGRVIEDARADDTIPVVVPSEHERRASCFDAATLAVIARLYRKHGTLCLQDIFDSTLLEACHARFLDDYRDYLGNTPQADALQIGDRRFQVSLELEGPFNNPGFYANPFLLGVMQRLIGSKVIIGSTVCATSLPGARDQHLHKDHRALFTADVDDEPTPLPPVAVTAMIPLVPLDEEVGTTVVKKGSHRTARRNSERLPSQIPCMPLGSCFLMDLSLSHRGQGNRSERVRPIVNMQYTQPWFVDNKNFQKHPPLQISANAYEQIPEAHRCLFDWATQPGARVGR